jgi:hypothetical protein
VRRHRVFAGLLVVGAVLRLVALLSLRPALEFLQDSYQYLLNAQHLQPDVARPLLYPVGLRGVSWLGGVGLLVALQHAVVLAAAALLYAALCRSGLRRWLAALATAPLLLDAYQINIEQFVLSEVLFEVLLILATACLLWRARLSTRAATVAGLAVAGLALTRSVGVALILPVLLLLLVRRVGWRPSVAFAAAVAVPLLGYASWFSAVHGSPGLQRYTGMTLASQAMTIADCRHLRIPAEERPLCVPQPIERRHTSDWYAQFPTSPLRRLVIPPGHSYDSVARDFADRVIQAQPGAFALLTGRTFSHYFKPGRSSGSTDTPDRNWTFAAVQLPIRIYILHQLPDPYRGSLPYFGGDGQVTVAGYGFGGAHTVPTIWRPGERALANYQRFAYTPGPLLALCALLAAVAGLGRLPPDLRRLRWNALFLAASAIVLLLTSALTATFDFRYLLPELPLLPAAGALAGELVARRLRPQSPDPEPVGH